MSTLSCNIVKQIQSYDFKL